MEKKLTEIEDNLFGKCPYVTAQKNFSGKWTIIKVEYSLTEIGKEFVPILKHFEEFGYKYINYIKTSKGVV